MTSRSFLVTILALLESCHSLRTRRPQSTNRLGAVKYRISTSLLLLTCALCSCGRNADTVSPTATEVFHLRSECADLAQKILKEHSGFGVQRALSHYEPATNRCYVELKNVDTHELYDGQTGEVLASTFRGSGYPPLLSGGTKAGLLKLPRDDVAAYQAVEDFIRLMMEDKPSAR